MLHFPVVNSVPRLLGTIALALSVLLSGCSLLPSFGPEMSDMPPRAVTVRSTIAAFSMVGRIAVHQGERHYASNISWQHAAESDEMLFTTPLGQGIAELIRSPDGARLTTADHREFVAADWESLAARVFGIELPLSTLPRWLLADVPVAAQEVARDEAGRPQHMRIDGWWIGYADYESAAAEALPTLIELRRDDIEVRLKIDEWQSLR